MTAGLAQEEVDGCIKTFYYVILSSISSGWVRSHDYNHHQLTVMGMVEIIMIK